MFSKFFFGEIYTGDERSLRAKKETNKQTKTEKGQHDFINYKSFPIFFQVNLSVKSFLTK